MRCENTAFNLSDKKKFIQPKKDAFRHDKRTLQEDRFQHSGTLLTVRLILIR